MYLEKLHSAHVDFMKTHTARDVSKIVNGDNGVSCDEDYNTKYTDGLLERRLGLYEKTEAFDLCRKTIIKYKLAKVI